MLHGLNLHSYVLLVFGTRKLIILFYFLKVKIHISFYLQFENFHIRETTQHLQKCENNITDSIVLYHCAFGVHSTNAPTSTHNHKLTYFIVIHIERHNG